MANNTFDFSDTIEAITDKVTIETQNYAINITEGAIANTRFDTGRMVGNWIASVDAPSDTDRDPILSGKRRTMARANANGDRAISDAVKAISDFSIEDNELIFIQNNTDYIEIWNEQDSIATLAIAGADLK